MRNTCSACRDRMKNLFFGQAFTNYVCNNCEEVRTSSTTHRPAVQCEECSDRNGLCMECGRELTIEDNNTGGPTCGFSELMERYKNEELPSWLK